MTFSAELCPPCIPALFKIIVTIAKLYYGRLPFWILISQSLGELIALASEAVIFARWILHFLKYPRFLLMNSIFNILLPFLFISYKNI